MQQVSPQGAKWHVQIEAIRGALEKGIISNAVHEAKEESIVQ